jgi:[ribosomal protein S5]-alanine N-acetyltransferase
MILPTQLSSHRLMMRPHREDDFDDFFACLSDPEATRFFALDDQEKTRAGAHSFFEEMLASYQSDSPILGLALVERESGTYLGFCGLTALDGQEDVCETIYVLRPQHWGKGYATELGHLLFEYAFTVLDVAEIVSFLAPENNAAIRVAERLGMEHEGRTTHRGFHREVLRYAVDRSAYFDFVGKVQK